MPQTKYFLIEIGRFWSFYIQIEGDQIIYWKIRSVTYIKWVHSKYRNCHSILCSAFMRYICKNKNKEKINKNMKNRNWFNYRQIVCTTSICKTNDIIFKWENIIIIIILNRSFPSLMIVNGKKKKIKIKFGIRL